MKHVNWQTWNMWTDKHETCKLTNMKHVDWQTWNMWTDKHETRGLINMKHVNWQTWNTWTDKHEICGLINMKRVGWQTWNMRTEKHDLPRVIWLSLWKRIYKILQSTAWFSVFDSLLHCNSENDLHNSLQHVLYIISLKSCKITQRFDYALYKHCYTDVELQKRFSLLQLS